MSLISTPHPAKKPNRADEQIAAALGAVQNLNGVLGMVHRGIQSINGAQSVGVQARQLNGNDQTLSSSAGRLAGLTLFETSDTGRAVVKIRDGFDATGDLLAVISLAAGESVRDWFMPHGIAFVTGVYVEIVTGTIEGAVHLAPAAMR